MKKRKGLAGLTKSARQRIAALGGKARAAKAAQQKETRTK